MPDYTTKLLIYQNPRPGRPGWPPLTLFIRQLREETIFPEPLSSYRQNEKCKISGGVCMKGAEQLARRGRPLARRGSGRASGETQAPGQRAPFLAASGLQASAAAGSTPVQQPPLQPRPVKNNAASYQLLATCTFPRLDTHQGSRLGTRPGAHTFCLSVSSQFGSTKSC